MHLVTPRVSHSEGALRRARPAGASMKTYGSSTFSVGDGSRNLKFSSHEVEDSDHIDR